MKNSPSVMEEPKLRALRLAARFLMAGPALYLVLVILAYPQEWMRGIGPALALLAATLAALLLSLRRPILAAALLIYGGFVAICLSAVLAGGMRASQFASMPLVVLLAGWLLGARHAIVMAVLSIGFTLGLAAVANAGLLATQELPPTLIVALPVAIVVSLICALTIYIVNTHDREIREVSRLRDDLAQRVGELQTEREHLRLVAENVPALILHGDRDLRCLYANRQFADFFHGDGVPIAGMHLREILGEAVFQAALPNLRRVLAGESVMLEGERQSRHQGERFLEISLVPERNAAGEVVGFFALKRDVSDRRKNEERLRLATSQGGIGIWEWDVSTGKLEWNDQLKMIFGVPLEARDLTLDRFLKTIHQEDLGRVQATYEAALADGREFSCEYRLLRPDGALRWILAKGHGQYDPDGKPLRMVGVGIDVTERRAAEEKFRKVLAANPVALAVARVSDGRYLEVNESYVRQFGWSREDIVGRTSIEIGLWGSVAEREAWVGVLRAQRHVRDLPAVLYDRARNRHDALISGELIDVDGEECVISAVFDVTDRKRAEDEVLRLNADLERRVRERTAELTAANRELESFAYSISHDLRAPLRSIDGFSHHLAEEFGEVLGDTGRGHLDRVRRAAQRMGTLIDDLLELSRVTRQEMHRVSVNLSQFATELMEEAARAHPERRVRASIAPQCVAFGDPQLLRVLMQNLVENAFKYSSKSKAPAVEFGRETIEGEVVYFVRDNGVGFDMKYADRLFTPFQRLHRPEEFEGTGVGLASVARVVRRHGGRIWAEAKPGEGATFRFTLGE